MLSHSLDHAVLALTVHRSPGIAGRAELVSRIEGLIHGYKPGLVVITLEEAANENAAVSVVLRAHRICNDLGIPMSAVTGSASVRRVLEASAETGGRLLTVHPHADAAVAAAFDAAA
ncbi:hypothetical protein [Streptomyces parvulus]|uniref:hypothetical protein n=1 Tax=Streptomyces parvulus TaxID=146923 RepID=UPI003EBF952A